MVDQNLVNYLKEGKQRGFSINLLKQKLLEGGFNEKDIDDAAKVVDGPQIQSGFKPPMSIQEKPKQQPASLPINQINKQSSSGIKWMKIAGWSGIFILIIPFISFIIGLAFMDLLLSTVGTILSIVVGLLMVISVTLYLVGFVKLGRVTQVGKLKMGSLLMVISYLVLMALGIIFSWMFTNNPLILLSNSGLIYLIVLASIILVGIIGQFIFSFGLLNAGEKIRFEKAAGILNLIVSISILVAIGGVISSIFLLKNYLATGLAAANLLGGAGLGMLLLSASTIQLAGLGIIASFITKINGIILEIMILFKASKEFEN
jgi:hypothetical protein